MADGEVLDNQYHNFEAQLMKDWPGIPYAAVLAIRNECVRLASAAMWRATNAEEVRNEIARIVDAQSSESAARKTEAVRRSVLGHVERIAGSLYWLCSSMEDNTGDRAPTQEVVRGVISLLRDQGWEVTRPKAAT